MAAARLAVQAARALLAAARTPTPPARTPRTAWRQEWSAMGPPSNISKAPRHSESRASNSSSAMQSPLSRNA
eukprot:12688526-Alexandrium_andersonii.AAC.1